MFFTVSDSRRDSGVPGSSAVRAAYGAVLALLLAVAPAAAELPLAGVGQLLVPGIRYENGRGRHYDERCSATLVTTIQGRPSPWLLTAWHCLEYYRDLSRPIVFVHASGERTTATASSSGGDMAADWALLRLAKPMPDAVALVSTETAPGTPLVMAGYSRREDVALPPLATDRGCRVTEPAGADLASDCHARRGASGGAVFAAEGRHRYLGIISRGDSDRLSIFVPLSRLADHLRPLLELAEPDAAGLRHR